MRPHIVKLVMRAGLLKEWEVFLLVRRDRVVEHDNLDGAPVLPEVSIVLLHGFAHIAETIRGDHEIQPLRLHKVPSLFVVIRPQPVANQQPGFTAIVQRRKFRHLFFKVAWKLTSAGAIHSLGRSSVVAVRLLAFRGGLQHSKRNTTKNNRLVEQTIKNRPLIASVPTC